MIHFDFIMNAYETIGFTIHKTKNYGFLTRSAGFKEVTHMVKKLD
jgi:hypothetical protein